MDLQQLLEQLMEQEGLTEDEALELASAKIRAQRKSGAIQKRPTGVDFAVSVQDDGRGVDYGNESPADAERRWKEQERLDPQGVYSPGGASTGGIFGSGAVPMEDYDPEAVNRSVAAVAQVQNAQVSAELLRELREMREERRQLQQPLRRQLDSGRGDGRRLGRKRRDGD